MLELFILLVLLLLAALPTWPYSRRWGYAPSLTLAVVLIVLILVASLVTMAGGP